MTPTTTPPDRLLVRVAASTAAALSGLGFTLADTHDARLRELTLPADWTAEDTEDGTTTLLLDALGRRRVSVQLERRSVYVRTLGAYLDDCRAHDLPVITDGTWATPQAIATAARHYAKDCQATIDLLLRRDQIGQFARAAELRAAERDWYLVLAAEFEAQGGAL